MKWDSVDFEGNTITIKSTVNQHMVDGKYELHLKDRAKNESSMRTFPLMDEFAGELLAQK